MNEKRFQRAARSLKAHDQDRERFVHDNILHECAPVDSLVEGTKRVAIWKSANNQELPVLLQA